VAILFWNKPYELCIISKCKNILWDTYYNLLQCADAVLFNRVQLKLDPMYNTQKHFPLFNKMPSTELCIYYVTKSFMFQPQHTIIRLGIKNTNTSKKTEYKIPFINVTFTFCLLQFFSCTDKCLYRQLHQLELCFLLKLL